jgi:hypothetical protein
MSDPRTPLRRDFQSFEDETTLFVTPEAPAYSPITPVTQVENSLRRVQLSSSEPGDEESSSDSDESEDMPDIVFTGKASELPGVLAHCKVTFLAKSAKYSKDQTKSSYFASLFRGTALEWLGTKLENDDSILDNYDEFQTLIESHFGISDATKERIAEQAIRRLRQTGSAQKFANDFDAIAEDIGIPDDTKPNFFRPGLKADVAKALVGKDTSTWKKLRQAAIEVDEELYAIRQRTRRGKAKGLGKGGGKKDDKGKH